MKTKLFLLLFLAVFCSNIFSQVDEDKQVSGSIKKTIQNNAFLGTTGPKSGSLVIVGGAMKDTSIINRFISLCGGFDSPIIVIPTASGRSTFDNQEIISFLTSAGATRVEVLHTYDPEIANTEEFVNPLKDAKGIWFTGGRQWRLVDAYANTLAEKEFRNVLKRGGVIGGTSAGASIMGSFLVRGDTSTSEIMIGDHQRGFSYLANCAIDQHLLARNRQNDLIDVVSLHPELLGIGIDENIAIVVKGNEFEVIGHGYVAIYDYNLWRGNNIKGKKLPNGVKYFFLRSGDIYNVKSREVKLWDKDPYRNIFFSDLQVKLQ